MLADPADLSVDRRYWEHPYTGDVAKGSAVMLLFTVKKGSLPNGLTTVLGVPPVKFGAYLNVLGIVVLAEPSEPFSELPSQKDPKAFGIGLIREPSEAKGTEGEAGDDPFLQMTGFLLAAGEASARW